MQHRVKRCKRAAALSPWQRWVTVPDSTRPSFLGQHCRLTLDEKYALCRSIGEECVQEEELRALLDKKPNPVAYDGFEPSGRMHIAQVRRPAVQGAVVAMATALACVCWGRSSHCRTRLQSLGGGLPACYPGSRPVAGSQAGKVAVRCAFVQGVLKALNVNKLTKSGVTFKFW